MLLSQYETPSFVSHKTAGKTTDLYVLTLVYCWVLNWSKHLMVISETKYKVTILGGNFSNIFDIIKQYHLY